MFRNTEASEQNRSSNKTQGGEVVKNNYPHRLQVQMTAVAGPRTICNQGGNNSYSLSSYVFGNYMYFRDVVNGYERTDNGYGNRDLCDHNIWSPRNLIVMTLPKAKRRINNKRHS